jgi:cyclase
VPLHTRRQFLQTILTGAVGLTITWPVFGQDAPPITATKLTPTLVLFTGNGGNIALLLGTTGLMLIDGGLPDRTSELMKAIATVDARPVTTVFNTHWHYDHTGSNEQLGKSGARIVAHENTAKYLGRPMALEALNMTFEPLQPHGIPKETFSTRGALTFDKETVEYVHPGPAHTDGDAYVLIRSQNVLHTGDLLFAGFYPFIDYSTGGWIGGMIAATDQMYKACDASTRVIPGHGPLSTREDLKASHDMLVLVHERLSTYAKKGASVDEVVKAMPNKDLDPKWGKGFMNPENFVRIAYTGLLRHQQASR